MRRLFCSVQKQDNTILYSKILNVLHFILYGIILYYAIRLLSYKTEQVIYYAITNFIAILSCLIIPLVVGYRLYYIYENLENNKHCFINFVFLIYYLSKNDELKLFRYVNYFAPILQLISWIYFNLQDFHQISSDAQLIELLENFNRLNISLALWNCFKVLVQAFFYCLDYRLFQGILRQYQHYILLQDNQKCYNKVMKITRAVLFISLIYQGTKIVICIIILVKQVHFLIILICCIILINTISQIACTSKLLQVIQQIQRCILQSLEINHLCFQNYYCLIESLMKSQRLMYYNCIFYFFYLMQIGSLIGLVCVGIQDLPFDIQQVAVIDSFIVVIYMAVIILKKIFNIMLCCQKERKIIFQFQDYQLVQVQQGQTEQKINIVVKEELICCICLQQLIELSSLKQLECNGKHSFHIQCIDHWLLNHQFCPLCKQVIQNN